MRRVTGRLVLNMAVLALLTSVSGLAAADELDVETLLDEAAAAAGTVIDGSAPSQPGPSTPPVPAMEISPTAIGAGLAAMLFAGGIRHITRNNVLEHDARKRIYEYLWETGGANLRTIADTLSLSTTNAMWHLDKLAKSDMVGTVHASGYKMYYPKGAGRLARDLCLAKGLLANDNAKAVMAAVDQEPGTHQREIARTLGINHGTVRWHLQRLTDAGLIEAVQTEARTRGFMATDLGRQATAQPQGRGAPRAQVTQSNI